MQEALAIIERNQIWIYLTLGLVALIYLRVISKRVGDLRRAFFGLERERAREQLLRAGSMFAFILLGMLAVFLLATFAGPMLPSEAVMTERSMDPLLDSEDEGAGSAAGTNLATPASAVEQASGGCANPEATIFSPEPGESMRGIVELSGVAAIPAFAFYRIEVKSMAPEAEWRTIVAGTEAVCPNNCPVAEILGRWDTSLFTPGEYALRLSVTDASGNGPVPCEFNVRVLPSE